jgi:hypothetical protein
VDVATIIHLTIIHGNGKASQKIKVLCFAIMQLLFIHPTHCSVISRS